MPLFGIHYRIAAVSVDQLYALKTDPKNSQRKLDTVGYPMFWSPEIYFNWDAADKDLAFHPRPGKGVVITVTNEKDSVPTACFEIDGHGDPTSNKSIWDHLKEIAESSL